MQLFIHEQRLIKSAAEIQLLEKACEISALAHISVMRECQQKQREFDLEGVFVAKAYELGCRQMAYMPIVGAGNNACTLHYTRNDALLKSAI